MGIKDFLILQRLQLGIISLTLLMVLILLGLVVGPALSQPPVLFKSLETPSRTIASLGVGGGIEITKVETPSSFPTYETIDLSCLSASTTKAFKTGSKHIRIRGRSCAGTVDTDRSVITNLSSGHSATVFATAAATYSTDFVRLVDGKNEIDFKIEGKDGRVKTAKIVIEKIQEF